MDIVTLKSVYVKIKWQIKIVENHCTKNICVIYEPIVKYLW